MSACFPRAPQERNGHDIPDEYGSGEVNDAHGSKYVRPG